MFKKVIAILLVIATVFSFATFAIAADETTTTDDTTVSDLDINAIKDKLVYTLVEFASKLNSSARDKLEDVITEKLIEYVSAKTGLSINTVKFIIENALKIAGVEGILHIDAEKADKFVTFMFDNFGKYLPENSKALADVYIWLASDKFGNWLNDIANGNDPSGNEDPTTEPATGAFDRIMETVTFIFNKLATFFQSFFSHFIPLVTPPTTEATT